MPRSAKPTKTKTPRVKPAASKAPAKVLPAVEPMDEELNKSELPASQRVWSNQEIAALLDRIGDILAIEGENRFKIIAYQRASDVIEHSARGTRYLGGRSRKFARDPRRRGSDC